MNGQRIFPEVRVSSQARGHCCSGRLGLPGGNNVIVSLGHCEVGGRSEKPLRGMRGANVLVWGQICGGQE